MRLDRRDLQAAAERVASEIAPTPVHSWPTLSRRLGVDVVVKHENHTPTGAFKVRGGVTYLDWLRRAHPACDGVVAATRGNHGQSIARAATRAGLSVRIVVPHGNSPEKNAAMIAWGADLVEHGVDFDAARLEAEAIATREDLHFVPSFHPELVRGVATAYFEMLSVHPDIHTLYVPIGCGSGICGAIAARDALRLKTRIVGVVSENAQTARLSFDAKAPVATGSALTFADGIAVRDPVPEALAIYAHGAERIVTVTDDQIAEAIRLYFTDTHNVAEGAGAAPLAALMAETAEMRGRKVGLPLCGGNIDRDWMLQILLGQTPVPR